MDNNLFIKNILILIFFIILIHIFLNNFLLKSYNNKNYKNNKNNKIIIYYFYAEWCTHCKYYTPIFKEFKNKIKNDENIEVDIFEIDAENENINKELYDKYNIEGFPTTIIIKNNIITTLVGKKSVNELISIVYGKNIEHYNGEENIEQNNAEENVEQNNAEENVEQNNAEENNIEEFQNNIKEYYTLEFPSEFNNLFINYNI